MALKCIPMIVTEKLTAEFDFSPDLATGETISSVTSVTVTPATGLTKSGSASLDDNNVKVYQTFEAVTAGLYNVDILVATSGGHKFIGRFPVWVES